jgi:predicted secreted protein
MARIIGNEGSVSVATHNITANAWSMSISRVISDVTAFGDASTKVRGGIPTYTGSVSGFMADDSAPNLVETYFETGDQVVITLIAQSGNQWSGSAVISGVSVGSSKTGDATISLDFTYDGGVAESWA